MQTESVPVCGLDNNKLDNVPLIFDCGSQRIYVSDKLRKQLKLPTLRSEKISINTFGNKESVTKMIDVVPLKFVLKNEIIQIECLCTSLICNDIVNQHIMSISSSYPHLKNLSLADSSNSKNRTIDIFIGAEHYYRFIYGNVIRGKINGPITVESLFGWVLTGYYDAISTTNNFNATHMIRVNSEICEHSNDDYKTMKKF